MEHAAPLYLVHLVKKKYGGVICVYEVCLAFSLKFKL